MRSLVSAAAVGALFLSGASLALAQGPGGSPGGDSKPPAKDAGPASGEKKGAPEKKEPGTTRDAPDKGKDDARAGEDRGGSGKKEAESPPDKGKKSDKSDRKTTDTDRKDETPKASAPGDDKSDRKASDPRRNEETPKASGPTDDKGDRKATDTRKDETPKASAPETDRTGKAGAPGGDDKKGVELTEQKRTTVHEKLSRDRTRHVTNVRFTVSIGATVPRNVEVYDLPPDVIEIVPEYRSYRYVWVGEEIVIIDPARYVVIAVVGGGSRSAGPSGHTRLTLTEPERRIVVKHIPSGQAVRERIEVGGRIPESVKLMAFPNEVITEVPRLKDYRYVLIEDDIAIVDPQDTTVLVKIDSK